MQKVNSFVWWKIYLEGKGGEFVLVCVLWGVSISGDCIINDGVSNFVGVGLFREVANNAIPDIPASIVPVIAKAVTVKSPVIANPIPINTPLPVKIWAIVWLSVFWCGGEVLILFWVA